MDLAGTLEPAVGLDLHSGAILLHIVLMTYWLGGDLGVFYSSRWVINPSVPGVARSVALKIMHLADLAPRVCLILMLPSGVTLMAASDFGRDLFLGWPLALVWAGSLAWLVAMLVSYLRSPARYADLASRADWVVRIAVTVALLATSLYALVVAEPFGVDTNPKWLAAKVGVYALCILCGIMIRVSLKPFGPAFAAMMAGGSTPEAEAAIGGAMKRAMPWVVSIWTLIVVAAFLGVVKPGAAVLGG